MSFAAAAWFLLAAIAACDHHAPANQSRSAQPGAPVPQDVSAIQEAANAYLKTQRAEATSHVPADWAPLVPESAGAPMPNADPPYLLPPWRLQLDGESARLRYTPPQDSTRDHRFWFELRLEKVAQVWRVSGDGLTFGHAWRGK